MITRRGTVAVRCILAESIGLLLLLTAGWCSAADLYEGVDQLANQLAKSVPEGRTLRVAVTDFPDLQGVTSNLGRYIAERMTTRLSAQTQKFRVIERRRLGAVLGELKFSMSDLIDPGKAKQLGRMLGVEGLVVGSLSDLGNSVEVDARIIEIETNNVLPGVSAMISKDQTVAQMLGEGRESASGASSLGGTPGTAPSSASAPPGGAGPKRPSGVHSIQKKFNWSVWSGMAITVLNAEIVDGQMVRLNCVLENRTSKPVEVSLDDPVNTTFLVDQLGRQHPLVQASGLSGEQLVRVGADGSRRFSLTFPLAAGTESFQYRTTLFVRASGDRQWRMMVEGEKAISLSDFR